MLTRLRSNRGFKALVSLAVGLCLGLPAQVSAADLETLKGMSLEELADLQVSILSKRPERLADSAAAVYVLTAEDIRRSGYTSIPELLRLVPGFTVAQADTGEWAISSRGFNGRFANKLLVMIDGRSVYTPLFSGVFWEAFDTMLEDIERIEVIRGPGASSWGANAVNGVINVITKHAGQTEGTLVSGYGGDRQQGLAVRQGESVGDRGYLRIFAKYDERQPELGLADGTDKDDFRGRQVGFRGDWDATPTDNLTFQGNGFSDDSHDPSLAGGDLMMQWEHVRDSGAGDTLRLSYDRLETQTDFDGTSIAEDLDTIDSEYRHHFAQQGRHDLNAGIGYRWYRSLIAGSDGEGADPAKRDFMLFSTFIQDEIALLRDRWYLTLGTKLEHNDFTGMEIQPSIRMRWNPRPDSTLWAAISRAVRTPSRGEYDLVGAGTTKAASADTQWLPLTARTTGEDRMESENLIAYELGYRWRPTPVLGFDLAMYYNDYDELRTLEYSDLRLELDPTPRWVVSVTPDNLLRGHTYGFDLVADWRPAKAWRLQAWYSLMRMDLHQLAASTDPEASGLAGRYPQQEAGLRAAVDLRRDLELDLYTRFVDQLPDFDVDAYLELDTRLAWHVNPHLTLALVGRNLLHSAHLEYGNETLGSEPHEIAREAYLRVEFKY